MTLCANMHIDKLIQIDFKLICLTVLQQTFAGSLTCRADEIMCNNTLCKLLVWLCDGEDDCGDNSDEDADMCGMFCL